MSFLITSTCWDFCASVSFCDYNSFYARFLCSVTDALLYSAICWPFFKYVLGGCYKTSCHSKHHVCQFLSPYLHYSVNYSFFNCVLIFWSPCIFGWYVWRSTCSSLLIYIFVYKSCELYHHCNVWSEISNPVSTLEIKIWKS